MCLLLCCSACAKAPPGQAELALGTKCSVNLYEYGSPKLYSRVFERIREIDRTMSARKGVLHSQLSTVMLINHNAGIAPVKVGADLFEVLEKALYYAELSNGAFDPTVGPLVNAWGIGTETENIPDKTSIDQALALINRKDVILDREQGTAYLQRKGMELDLGAIVKGYAADEAVRIAGEAQAGHAIIDLGGNIAAMGSRGSGKHGIAASPWRIGIQDPLAERNVYIGMVLVSDKSVVTSGVYERYFEQDGKRYHHILSTQDGYPVDNGLLSVTIIADRSIDADGLSTAVFALGFQQGLNLLTTIPGTEAIFIFDNRSVYLSGGLIDSFILTTDKYTIIDTIRAETVMDRP
jgi:thiamine biosynthesis lipoprotein